MLSRLSFLYGTEAAARCLPELERLCRVYQAYKPEAMITLEQDFDPGERFTEEDIILITYGDMIRSDDQKPLDALTTFCDSFFSGINTLHLLPYFPFPPNRDAEAIDLETVDPAWGTWEDVEALGNRYHVMFDGVISHVSFRSRWFQEFLKASPYFKNFFVTHDPGTAVDEQDGRSRSRAAEVVTCYQGLTGPVYVRTTRGADRIGLNYHHPDVLLRVIDLLLFHIRQGVDLIRLDQADALWGDPVAAETGLPQAHEIVKLIRDILDLVAPAVSLVADAGGTLRDRAAFFGNGRDEAHMVYNPALPPLVLHTFHTQDADRLTGWADTLAPPSDATAFFNVLDTNEGIGLAAVRDILTQDDIKGLVEKTVLHGGYVSYAHGPDGRDQPDELNITWFSALNPEDSSEDLAFQVKRFVASRAVSLMLRGVPGIYLPSLAGIRNDPDAVASTHCRRAVNRSILDEKNLHEAGRDPMSKLSRIRRELGRLISIRSRQRAFHPNGPQRVLQVCPAVFALVRRSPEGDETILCLVNVTPRAHHLEILTRDIGSDISLWYDLVSGVEWMVDGDRLALSVHPYDVIWLQPVSKSGDFMDW